jgi:hypothetical protein
LQLNKIDDLIINIRDDRTDIVRIAHTVADSVIGVAFIVSWQLLFGVEETGCMAALLRLLGFVPAVINTAWIQVNLAKTIYIDHNSKYIAIGGLIIIVLLGSFCALAIEYEWLGKKWGGIINYILPMIIWQGSTCIATANMHKIYSTGKIHIYSKLCICLTCIQSVILLVPIILEITISKIILFYTFTIVSSCGILFISIFLNKKSKLNSLKLII